ncbi:MAG: hypothetical protein EOO56_18950 [Hymenobacter sp.]|nr:MAG: hypothetical protein EOO56_18950 [Hymenobacter sp.]
MSPVASFCAGLCLLLFAACGQKPDGTSYGVNPAKHSDGHRLTKNDSAATRFKGNKIPKAGELNAITNGARSGQPAIPAPAQ